MRREGSPWHGMGVVFLKELSDHLTSVRMRVLEWLVVLTGLATIGISLVALWLWVIGLGLVLLGLPPSVEEMARAFIMLGVTVVYAGVWLALAMLFSIVFRSAATAALVSLGLWLFFTILWPLLSPAVAAVFSPGPITSAGELLSQLGTQQAFARGSP